MIGLKNTSEKAITAMFDGVEYTFTAKEVKLIPQAVASHLVKASFTCALGSSPLKIVPLDAIPGEILASPGAVSKDVVVLANTGDSPLDLTFNGEIYTIPAQDKRVFPADIGRALLRLHTEARRSGLVMSEVVPQRSEVSAPPATEAPAPDESEPQSGMDREVPPEADEPTDTSKKRGQKGKNK